MSVHGLIGNYDLYALQHLVVFRIYSARLHLCI